MHMLLFKNSARKKFSLHWNTSRLKYHLKHHSWGPQLQVGLMVRKKNIYHYGFSFTLFLLFSIVIIKEKHIRDLKRITTCWVFQSDSLSVKTLLRSLSDCIEVVEEAQTSDPDTSSLLLCSIIYIVVFASATMQWKHSFSAVSTEVISLPLKITDLIINGRIQADFIDQVVEKVIIRILWISYEVYCTHRTCHFYNIIEEKAEGFVTKCPCYCSGIKITQSFPSWSKSVIYYFRKNKKIVNASLL